MSKSVGDTFEYTVETYNEDKEKVERVYLATVISDNIDEDTYTISINGLGITKDIPQSEV